MSEQPKSILQQLESEKYVQSVVIPKPIMSLPSWSLQVNTGGIKTQITQLPDSRLKILFNAENDVLPNVVMAGIQDARKKINGEGFEWCNWGTLAERWRGETQIINSRRPDNLKVYFPLCIIPFDRLFQGELRISTLSILAKLGDDQAKTWLEIFEARKHLLPASDRKTVLELIRSAQGS